MIITDYSQDYALIGAGGYAREVSTQMRMPDIPMFIDDEFWHVNLPKNVLKLSKFDPDNYQVVVAIGDLTIRKNLIEKMPSGTKYFTFIDNSANLIDVHNIKIGKGSIIGPNCILTTNINIGEHSQLNLASSIGHDCILKEYFTSAPGARVSGNCEIGNRVYMGTNAVIKEKIKICDDVTIGMGACVVKDIKVPGTYIGVFAKLLIIK